MLFNSIDFALFLPAVFGIYWLLKTQGVKAQNIFLLGASYYFYGSWDWRFLGLIIFSTVVDYTIGRRLAKKSTDGKRKALLWASLTINLGLLAYFKYANFFLDNFIASINFLGGSLNSWSLQILLPVGISFYTFQTLSYTIDVYRGKLAPATDFVAFASFVSFFPQLVAGPIERATNLLPQFYRERKFEYPLAVSGMRQILWGLFKKVVIADNCAPIVNEIFANSGDYSGSTLLLGAVLFAFQIYGDFSGYSDIAIGVARLFGFRLMQNFAFPYFSRDISEFWRRWHISLSTWFRDYVYIPLGGSQGSTSMRVRNVFVIFLVSGFWHGANWTFIIWGCLNAIYFLPLLLSGRNRKNIDVIAENRWLPSLHELISVFVTFGLTVVAWVFFRADSVGEALSYLKGMFSSSLISVPQIRPRDLILLLTLFVTIEWLSRRNQFALEYFPSYINRAARWFVYYGLLLLIALKGGNQQEFIYFQF